ncbi:MAG: hypothetical protein R3E12_06350 [Candidatus Eisenbacteria bacterium]
MGRYSTVDSCGSTVRRGKCSRSYLRLKGLDARPQTHSQRSRSGPCGADGQGGADLDSILDLDRNRMQILQDVEVQKAERNKSSEEIARLKTGEDAGELLDRMKDLSERIKSGCELKEVEERDLGEHMRWIPNLPHGSVPVGDASANRRSGAGVGFPGMGSDRSRTTRSERRSWVCWTRTLASRFQDRVSQ